MTTAYCFDLDGTVSTLEILPCIAAELGVADEIATLTRLTMDGHIPFADSLRLRTLILGQVPVERVNEIIDAVPLDPNIVEFITAHADRSFIVTGNLNNWIAPLTRRLPCEWFSTQASVHRGRLQLQHILDKGEALRQIRTRGRYERLVAIGDGANDVPMLREADLAIAYGGVHPPAPTALSAANLVLHDSNTLCKLLKAL